MFKKYQRTKQLTLSDGIVHTGLFNRFQTMLLVLFMLSKLLSGIMTDQFQSLSVMQTTECISASCKPNNLTSEKLCQLQIYEWKFTDKSNWLTDFHLVCENEYLIRLETSVYFTGFFAAAFLLGYFCDKYGRRILSICCLAGYFGVLLVLRFSVRLDKVFLLRFIAGGLHSGILVSVLVAILEFNTQKNYWICAIIGSATFSLGKATISFMSYDHDQWQSTIDIPICIVIVALGLGYVGVPETPYFFYAQGKELHALVSLNEVAMVNRAILLKDTKLVMHRKVKEDHYMCATWTETFKQTFIRSAVFLLWPPWATTFISYFMLGGINDFKLDGNRYFGMMAASLSEIPLQIFTFLAAQKFGRKRTSLILLGLLILVFTVGCIPTWMLNSLVSVGSIPSRTIVMLLGKSCAGSLMVLLSVYTCEILPTLTRCTGLALCLTAASLSSLFLPFIWTLDEIWPPFRYILVVVFAVLSMITLQKVPETLSNPLPNNLTECVLLFRKQSAAVEGRNDLEMVTLLGDDSEDDF